MTAPLPTTVLVIDDSPDSLDLLTEMLRRSHYEVLSAPNGTLGFDLAMEHEPDLILLDINLPEMTGYELCQSLKKEDGLRDIPVIFVSALDKMFDKVQGFKVGGVDYITKPFHIDEVLVRVGLHLRLLQQRRELEELRFRDQLYLEKLTVFIESLMGTATHDLRNPLMGINLTLSVLGKYGRVDDERGQELLKRIQDQASGMSNLINELLDVAQIEAFREENS